MTTKDQFPDEQWDALREAPIQTAFYVIAASPSMFGAMKEAYSVAKSIAMAQKQPENTELMRYLLAEFSDKAAAKEVQPQFSSKDPVQVRAEGQAALQGVVSLLDEQATAEEAAQIKNWLYQVAVDTAKAAKEGGFLGIGAVRVSDAEKSALAELAEIFGVQADASEV